MGLQAVGLVVLGNICLANDSMASIDTRSTDGRIYVGIHKPQQGPHLDYFPNIVK